ncbi:MAG: radical SAM protein [Desulfovibrio sp.]|jgi:pyruvate formate lyase activating enzyme|nr:radical SAM protein [Desulfovibrio sp.]
MKAAWWRRGDKEGEAVCGLCPHACRIPEGKSGYCSARFCREGEIVSPYLGLWSAVAVDPIEKKPLYHWRPGTSIFSLGGIGCTMRCPFCQNYSIAQPAPGDAARISSLRSLSAREITDNCQKLKLNSVAYTYNEPALQAEFILATAPALREAGVETVLVSNGLYSEELLEALIPAVAAANIDIKTFSPKSYARLGGDLEVVKRTVSAFVRAGKHVECTTLVVPGISDNLSEFAAEVDWLADLGRDCGTDVPLHISRYRPCHKFTAPPTDLDLLQAFAALAGQKLRHVHIGNVPGLKGQRPSLP